MDWQAKIRRLLESKNASQLARSVGLHPSAIGDAAKKGQMPKADKAVKIARAMGVSADWLFNDERDWPPPKWGQASGLTHMEIVRELADRREMLRRDMYTIGDALPQERLERLAEIVTSEGRSSEEREELHAGLNDLFHLEMLARQLQWLDPDEVHPPQSTVLAGTSLAEPYPALRDELKRKLHEEHSVLHPHVAAPSGLLPKGPSWPVYQRVGDTVSEEAYLTMGRAQRQLYVPIVEHLALGLPSRSMRGQSHGPGTAGRYLRYDTTAHTAFGCEVLDDNMEPNYPKGTIVVCEPGYWETRPGDVCLALLTEKQEHGVYIFEGQTLRSTSPAHKSIRLKPEHNARIYRVVAAFAPAAAESSAAARPETGRSRKKRRGTGGPR